MVEAGDKGSAFETPNGPDSVTAPVKSLDATRLGPLPPRPPMSSTATNMDSLVYALVPQSRTDDRLRRELVDHCKEILNR